MEGVLLRQWYEEEGGGLEGGEQMHGEEEQQRRHHQHQLDLIEQPLEDRLVVDVPRDSDEHGEDEEEEAEVERRRRRLSVAVRHGGVRSGGSGFGVELVGFCVFVEMEFDYFEWWRFLAVYIEEGEWSN